MRTTQITSADPNTKFRLSPNEINLLIRSAIQTLAEDTLISFEMNASAVECRKITINKQTYIIFSMTKDEKNPFIESGLLSVGDVLKQFLALYPERDAILLMPLLYCQCFNYTHHWMPYARRAHAVLLAVDLIQNKMEIHDSQARKYYPDVCFELAKTNLIAYDQQLNYHAYNTQSDQYSCGYYVYRYVLEMLERGDRALLNKVSLNITQSFRDKIAYLSTCIPGYESVLSGPSLLEPLDDEEFNVEEEEGFYLV